MLARNSHHLIRIGHYLECAEQMAVTTKAYYLSAMDAPFPALKPSIWSFILTNNGASQAYACHKPDIAEEKVLQFVALADANPAAIRTLVHNARELAREVRNCLPAELWEHINCFYHSLNTYTEEKLQQKGFYSFAQKVAQYSYTIKGYLGSVMLRNESWKLLSLGYHLERLRLTNSLLLNTLREMGKDQAVGQAKAREDYWMRTMLESLGAYEMYKHHYQTQLNRQDFLHFMVFQKVYPRSMMFNLLRIAALHKDSGVALPHEVDAPLQQASKLITTLDAQQPESLPGNEISFLEETLSCLQAIAAPKKTAQAA